MAGQGTDSWTRTFTVDFTLIGRHTLVITEEGDGVNEPQVSAHLDGRPVQVQIEGRVLIDGITELVEIDDRSAFIAHVQDEHVQVYRSLGGDGDDGAFEDVPGRLLSDAAIAAGRDRHAADHAAERHRHTHPDADLDPRNR
jgi:hypothetical protein